MLRPGQFPTIHRAADAGSGGGAAAASGGSGAAAASAITPGGDAGGFVLSDAHNALLTTKGWMKEGKPDWNAALDGYSALERTLGADKLVLPGKDAKPEAWDAVYNKLGRPESADKYDLSGFKPTDGVPWDDGRFKAAMPKLHALGLTQAQLVGVAGILNEDNTAVFQGLRQAADKQPELTKAELQKTWGKDFDVNLDHANRLVKAAFGEDLAAAKDIRLMDGTYLLDNPAIAKAFAAAGKLMAEPASLPGAGGANGGGANGGGAVAGEPRTPAEADAEIRKIMSAAAGDKSHAYVNRDHPEHKALHERMTRLYTLRAGGGKN
ncbi:hypothetical protein [Ferrovibrio sp.]|uniref:hypothetical protein n=1 Tax=Ferrovibrio sp. TaxID=1917215 RepID=UPI003D0D159D